MKNQWQIWAIIGVVVVIISAIFGFQAGRSSLFAKKETPAPKIEYEFVSSDSPANKPTAVKIAVQTAAIPAAITLPSATAVSAAAEKKYAIQIASFADQAKADLEQKRAGQTGLTTYIAAIDLGEKGTWHRVYVGPFATKDEAAAELAKVKTSYQKSFVVAVK